MTQRGPWRPLDPDERHERRHGQYPHRVTSEGSDIDEAAHDRMPRSAAVAVTLAGVLAPLGLLRADAGRIASAVFPWLLDTTSTLLPAAAVGVALLASRQWPWLLLAGGALNLALAAMPGGDAAQSMLRTGESVVTPLVVVGALVAAQHLVRRGPTIPGVLVGAYVSVVIALDFDLGRFLHPTGARVRPATAGSDQATGAALILGLLSLAGGAIAVGVWVARRRASDPGDAVPDELGRWRGAVIGFVAAALPVAVVGAGPRVFGDGSAGSAVTMVAVTGGVCLLAAVVLAAVVGRDALIWTAVAALALVGAGLAVGVSVRVGHLTGQSLPPGVIGGLVAGAVLALLRVRAVLAAAGCVAVALAMALLQDAVAGDPTSLQRNAERVPNLGLIAVVVATLALVGGAAMMALARRRAAPVVLLPLVALFVTGAERLRTRYMLTGEGRFTGGVAGDFVDANVFSANLALAVAAALLLAVAAAVAIKARRAAVGS